MVLYSRPITFTPTAAPAQTRYMPSSAIIRPISYTAPTTVSSRPAGLTQPAVTPVVSGQLTQEVIEQRAQDTVNRYPSAPFRTYEVQGGYWYGVSTVDGMETRTKLNVATADTRPDPNSRYRATSGSPTFTEGSAGWSKVAPSARPTAPGPGSTKEQITAYSESLASWEREQLWQSIPEQATWNDISDWYGEARFDLPTEDRRAWEIKQSLLPAFPSAKAQAIESQYAQQQRVIVSSSGNLVPVGGGDYRNVSTGALFSAPAVLDLGAKAIAAAPGAAVAGMNLVQMQLATMRSPFDTSGRVDTSKATLPLAAATFGAGVGAYSTIAGKGVAVGLGLSPDTMQQIRTTALGLPVISTIWSAGEYIGLDYLIGAKTAEYQKEYLTLESQGIITGGEFRGTEAQYTTLDAKYQQLEHLQQLQNITLDRTLGVNVAEAQAGTAGTGWIYRGGAGITDWANTKLIKPAGETIGNLPSVAFGTVAVGMAMTGVPPNVLPHTMSFVKGFGQGVAAVPGFLGMAVVGAEGLIKHPEATPGAAMLGGYIQAKGIYEGVTTRPVEFAGEMYGTAIALGYAGRVGYALSPVKYTSAAFRARGMPTATYRGLYTESPIIGLKKLVGTRAEWVGTRNIAGTTSYEGLPWYRPQVSRGVPTHLVDYLSEGYVDFPGTVVKVPLVEERLIRAGRPGELTPFREELNLIDTMHGFKPSTIKDPVAEFQRIPGVSRDAAGEFLATLRDEFPTHRIGGSLAQSIQSRYSRAPADVDLYLPREQIAPFNEYVTQWNRRHGTSVKVDIHEYPQLGSYIGRYGVQTMKDITVGGTHFMHIGEQALRKSTSGMMLRDSREGWYIGPEAHRGKDIADMLGAVESELYRVRESPVGFLYRGKQARLTHAVDVLHGRMEPGALPTETIGGRFYDPSQAAAARYAQYTWDLTASPYVKFPGTQTYFNPTQYTRRVAATYAQFGVPSGTPWGVIFETGGKVRLHPEEVKMWEQMVIDESRGIIPREDIRLFTKKGELLRDFRKKREFGSVDIQLSNKAQRALDASTHTHPLSEVVEPAYYLKSEIWFDLFLDKFRRQPKWEPLDYTGKNKIFYQYEYSIPGIDAPLHTGDMFSGIGHGERVHTALTKDAVYVGKLPKDFFTQRRGGVLNVPYTGKLYEEVLTHRLKESGGKLSDIERSKLSWEVYREVALRSAGRAYSRMGGVYKRIPIKEVTNFAEFSSQALKALENTQKTPIEFGQFTLGRGTGRWVRGLSKTHKSIPEGTPTTNIRAIQEIPFGEYPTTYRSARSPVRPLITGYPGAVKVQHPPDFISSYVPTIPSLKKTTPISTLVTGKYPAPTITGGAGTYPGLLVDIGKYPTPVVDLPGEYPGITGGGKTPYPDLFTPMKTPYPKITRTTPKPYPGITRAGKTPYPSVRKFIPEKYPGVKITAGGGRTTITTITTGGEYGRTTTTSERQRITIPKTFSVPFTIPTPKKLVISKEEETPRKKLRLHFDVRGSKWIIKNPIPRPEVVLGGEKGKQYKNELKVYDIQRTKKTYTVHAPFDVITDFKVTKGLRF